MAERLNYAKAFPEGIHAVLNVEKAIRSSGLEPSLLELVKIRASQLNGCAYCLDMHTKTHARPEKRSSGSIHFQRGGKRRSLPHASAQHWPGRRL